MAIFNIPDAGSSPLEEGLDTNPEIWFYKNWRLQKTGGMVLGVPRPNPKYLSILGIENLNLKAGDKIIVAADNSNNPTYSANPNSKDPFILEVREIASPVMGVVKRVTGNRVEIDGELTVPAGDVGAGSVRWPKPGGAVTKVLGYARTMVNEKLTENVERAKRVYGSKWRDKADDGAWKKD